jgi:hypothetical protein
MIGN